MESSAATDRHQESGKGADRLAGVRLAPVQGDARSGLAEAVADPRGASGTESNELHAFREHALTHGVNPVLYWLARAVLVPFFLLYFRIARLGREHIPSSGPVLLAANHRSFLDPFVIGALTRRPVYYMAKRELFEHRWQAWVLNGLGAFPVDRGRSDEQAMATARAILGRGDCVVIFPEGTRVRPGPLAHPHRGVGRLALQTGAPVVPVAVLGTEDVRRGWRIRPRKVSLRCGRPLRFPQAERPTPAMALGVADRIWACVSLQWEWLGGASATPNAEIPPSSSERHARAA
ncbi:MAG TPA: lysophospholipid acyltransferase family protein [Solirubrobacteraceae bacterium]|jgi:1-acyl-sn-glycerol-3-phosphate acyltransferase|nr:lysophospholipid acyltransferase family protein [Solirubrobacteraceae bacterium]